MSLAYSGWRSPWPLFSLPCVLRVLVGRSSPSLPSASPAALPSRSTIRRLRSWGFWLRVAFSIAALWVSVASLSAQRMLYLARSSPKPVTAILAAISVYPTDPRFRLAPLEWVLLNPTGPKTAIRALDAVLKHDPSSPDALRIRMIEKSYLGLSREAGADARALHRFTPFDHF
jgi:hypothetical protein